VIKSFLHAVVSRLRTQPISQTVNFVENLHRKCRPHASLRSPLPLTEEDSWKIFQFRRAQLRLSARERCARAGAHLPVGGVAGLCAADRPPARPVRWRPKLSQSSRRCSMRTAGYSRLRGHRQDSVRRAVAARNWCPRSFDVVPRLAKPDRRREFNVSAETVPDGRRLYENVLRGGPSENSRCVSTLLSLALYSPLSGRFPADRPFLLYRFISGDRLS